MMHTHSHLFNGFFHFLLKNGVNFVFINYLVLVLEMFLLLVSSAVVEARIRIGWNKFRQLLPLLISRDISLIRTGRLYSSCVRSSMLHGSETWPVRKENEVALHRAEMTMVRWMCNVKVQGRVPSKELRERLGIDDVILILQQNWLRIMSMCCEKKTLIG